MIPKDHWGSLTAGWYFVLILLQGVCSISTEPKCVLSPPEVPKNYSLLLFFLVWNIAHLCFGFVMGHFICDSQCIPESRQQSWVHYHPHWVETHSSLADQLLWQFMASGGRKVSELAPSLPIPISREKLRFWCVVWCMSVNASMYDVSLYVSHKWTKSTKANPKSWNVSWKWFDISTVCTFEEEETLKEILSNNLNKTFTPSVLFKRSC